MDTINLTKNETINLTKKQDETLNLTKKSNTQRSNTIGLGWDAKAQSKPQVRKSGFFGGLFGGGQSYTPSSDKFDLDASLILCRNGKFVDRNDLVYYGNLNHNSGAVNHNGDNLTGDGDGDDEQITTKFAMLPDDVDKIVVFVNIFDAVSRHQHFGQVQNAFVRIVDDASGAEMCRYDLTGDYDGCTAMIFGEFNKVNGEWLFTAVGEGTHDGNIDSIVRRYR